MGEDKIVHCNLGIWVFTFGVSDQFAAVVNKTNGVKSGYRTICQSERLPYREKQHVVVSNSQLTQRCTSLLQLDYFLLQLLQQLLGLVLSGSSTHLDHLRLSQSTNSVFIILV